MTGRGRTCKAKSPDTKCAKSQSKPEEMKHESPPRCTRKDFKEEKQKGATKEQKPKGQKKTSSTDENPSAQSIRKEKTTKHFTEEVSKQQSTPADNKKAPVQGRQAETTEPVTKSKKMQPKGTTEDSPKTTKEKKIVRKEKSPEQSREEKTKVQPEDIKTAKTCIAKEKIPETKMQPVRPKENPKADRCEGKVDTILSTTLDKLRIKSDEKSYTSKVVNELVNAILSHLKQNTQCFKEAKPLRTGSYYENLKISNPDEFDVMLAIPVDRVDVSPFGDDGAFYSVELKRGNSPLKRFEESSTLSASKMLDEFRLEVKECAKKYTGWEVTRKKKGCPAVTLIRTVQSVTVSLDIVLSLVVKSSWPSFTKEGLRIDSWLGTKVKREYKWEPYYLVPKFEGTGTEEKDGVLAKDTWRVSFSHVEKAILKNHGSQKTCCEKEGERCCRKDCLKLLKHLLSLLKENNSSFEKFCSYHAKTTLLHACCSRTKDTDWRPSSLSQCFRLLLEDFVSHLEEGILNNFFIPTQNLLSSLSRNKCNSLARCIREECDKGFPIFK
ncbi:cyclic GMP-AMP synthase [Gymnodraco acuticeps]|uniref:Cyclic GMP-AMP synthase n=1 Tax=Gymnodraco acuticeps TaxID=8218 RepID=A0A6P8TNV4_GYMAC|nr:cyclic GMP-AMP synthase [Gymnodraco acuticeps]